MSGRPPPEIPDPACQEVRYDKFRPGLQQLLRPWRGRDSHTSKARALGGFHTGDGILDCQQLIGFFSNALRVETINQRIRFPRWDLIAGHDGVKAGRETEVRQSPESTCPSG